MGNLTLQSKGKMSTSGKIQYSVSHQALVLTAMIRNPAPSVSNTQGYPPALAQTRKDGYINTLIPGTLSGIPQEPCYSAWTSALIKAGDFMVS